MADHPAMERWIGEILGGLALVYLIAMVSRAAANHYRALKEILAVLESIRASTADLYALQERQAPSEAGDDF